MAKVNICCYLTLSLLVFLLDSVVVVTGDGSVSHKRVFVVSVRVLFLVTAGDRVCVRVCVLVYWR